MAERLIEDTGISISEDHHEEEEEAMLEAQIEENERRRKDIKEYYIRKQKKQQENNESIIEWFDRVAEDELEKHRNAFNLSGRFELDVSPGLRHPSVLDATAAGVDLSETLNPEMATDLVDACASLAKAEAIEAFEGAVMAAEKAAAMAPPELAEEAAMAGAKGYRSQVTSVVRQTVPGYKPIEVLGYVGITKPTRAYKTDFEKYDIFNRLENENNQ